MLQPTMNDWGFGDGLYASHNADDLGLLSKRLLGLRIVEQLLPFPHGGVCVRMWRAWRKEEVTRVAAAAASQRRSSTNPTIAWDYNDFGSKYIYKSFSLKLVTTLLIRNN